MYSSIEIEIILRKNKYESFINIKEEDKEFYHIYFNNNKKDEIKRTNLNEDERVSKINIIIVIKLHHFLNYLNFVIVSNLSILKNFVEMV